MTKWMMVLAAQVGMACGSGSGSGSQTATRQTAGSVARIQLELTEPTADRDASIEAWARFATYRGLDESFVRARANMSLPSQGASEAGECRPRPVSDPGTAPEKDVARQLTFTDVGNIDIELAHERISLPLSLVPDLVSYASGVEYVYREDAFELPDTPYAHVSIEGSRTFPASTVSSPVPPALSLAVDDEESHDGDTAVLTWTIGASDETVTVMVEAMDALEPVGEAITCVFSDVGQGALDLDNLRDLGLGGGDRLRITATRSTVSTHGPDLELVVKRHAMVMLLPR